MYKNAVAQTELKCVENTITIFSSIVAIDFLKPERIRLLQHFKNYYHNEEINVLFEVVADKVDENAPKIISSKEVYEKMISKNPLLQVLRERLGMDIER